MNKKTITEHLLHDIEQIKNSLAANKNITGVSLDFKDYDYYDNMPFIRYESSFTTRPMRQLITRKLYKKFLKQYKDSEKTSIHCSLTKKNINCVVIPSSDFDSYLTGLSRKLFLKSIAKTLNN